jgi:hypothetical protein
VFTTTEGYDSLYPLITLVSNCNLFCTTRAQEDDEELFETIKVSKFYEMVFDKNQVAMAVTVQEKSTAKSDAENVEMWPIIQAYGLDSK